MVYRFAFTYLGLLYAIILCLIYFAKQEFHETRNKLYKMLIIETIISCSLDALFSIFIGLKLDFFAGLLFKVYWFSIAFWTVIEYLYIYTVINDVSGFTSKDSVHAYVNRIKEIMSNKKLLKEVGKNAKEMLGKNWKDIAKETYKFYLKQIEIKKSK